MLTPNKSKKLTDFKALLFDVDKTLTNSKSLISPETIMQIKKLADLGYKIGVCTGRGTSSVRDEFLPLFPDDSLHITTGGSQLVNSKGEVVFDNPIDKDFVVSIRKYLNDSKYPSVFMKADSLYAKDPMFSRIKAREKLTIVEDLDKMTDDNVGAIYITNLDQEIFDYLDKKTQISYKQMFGSAGNKYIDVTSKGVNKATTLKKWSEKMDIPPEKIIGFGDSMNDYEFLQTCGFSVAMGNAVEEIKKIADRTIGHTDENGLAIYLSKIIQGENL